MKQITGGCLCRKVRFQAKGTPVRVGICHCLDCRKHHGAVFYAAAIYDSADVTVTGDTHHFNQRHFCPTCGSSVFARSGAEIELHLGALDEPSTFEPQYQGWLARRENWLPQFPQMCEFQQDRPQ